MSIAAVSTNGMSREEWLAERRKGIGGSDAGTIMGVNKYATPLDLYNEKMGLAVKDLSNNEAVHLGNKENALILLCDLAYEKAGRVIFS